MLRVALIGGGNHSRREHLPALARYVSEHPGGVEPVAFCDLNRDVAEAVAAEYGFGASYTDVAAMLEAERLDGCIAVTPVPVTAAVASQVVEAGVPLLMEKPPGCTPAEARRLNELVVSRNARVMVGMNRRFDPALSAAHAWRGDRPLEYVRATMLRRARREKDFFMETGLHALDALRWLAGDVREHAVHAREVDGAWWYQVHFEFESGVAGVLEVMPSCGSRAETYDLFGPGYRVRASSGFADRGACQAWEGGEPTSLHDPAPDTEPYVLSGTYAETVAFFMALRDETPMHPSPGEVLQSVELCHRIQNDVIGGTEQAPG